MSTLFIRLPSHAAAESQQSGAPLYCQFASVTTGGAIEREGVAALSELSEPVKRAQRVVLLLAACDVTLLRVQVPASLSGTRLKAALPNLVEDQLMSDPADCVMVAGELRNGMRMVAVVDRGWLEILNRTLVALGARRIAALPSQLCLPPQADGASAAVSEHGADIDVAIRLTEQEGIGLSFAAEQPEAAAFETMQGLAAVVPTAHIDLYVPQTRLRDYEDSLHIAPSLKERITLHADSWQRWTNGAGRAALDLMSGLGAAAGPSFDWRPWRVPVAMALAVLLVNVIGLNVEWLRAKREAEALRTGMTQAYRAAFPKEPAVVDPLLQLRRKIAGAQRDSGQLAPDDFVALAAGFGDAWASTGEGTPPLARLEYREHGLTFKLKSERDALPEQLTGALAARDLSIKPLSAGTWQIRSSQ